MRIKICGITNLEDAFASVEAGADALGFVFYEKSPRYIAPKDALEIVQKLPPFIERVGLFVNSTSEFINSTCMKTKMSTAQVHFEANKALFDKLELPYLRVIRAKHEEDIRKHGSEYRIVDAFVQGYGGEGKRVDLSWFEGADCSKIILAGGLNCSNVDEVNSLDFYGLDVSSGVEKSHGKKDKRKIFEFIKKSKIEKF